MKNELKRESKIHKRNKNLYLALSRPKTNGTMTN